ncbi:hypothetical protein DVH24_024051 [Malus domestica]|uniref:F-box domain-containing protein n=1 Tax=Malus domestica TaxID=3750 RepID=A0A498JHT5_MALDO|nr:hypothetical protein DVH24_024051 [Malus domestica]
MVASRESRNAAAAESRKTEQPTEKKVECCCFFCPPFVLNDSGICEDLWFEILCRLPQLDLVRFKMVSKSWHRITSQVWLRKFWLQSPVLGIYYLTLVHSEDEYHLINYASVNFCHSHTCMTSDRYVDCCNGLLLLFTPCADQLCVSNPITGRNLFCAALAYDPIESNHYRVVRINFSQ